MLAHGLAGAGSLFTGALLAVPTVLLIAFGDWRQFRPHATDLLFTAFVALVGISVAINGVAGDIKELALLSLTLAAYPAARLSGRHLLAPGFFAVASAAVLAVAVATAIALAKQWTWSHGKPLVFDQFDAAPTQCAALLGLLVLTIATSEKLSVRQVTLLGLAASLPAAIFAASMVRFTFIALGLSLLAAIALKPAGAGRRAAILISLIVMSASVLGAAARWHQATIFLHHAATVGDLAARAPDARLYLPDPADAAHCPPIDIDNSIAVRKQLYIDAAAAIPNAGPFGIGLDGFLARSCIKGFSPHNAFLQAAIEFGWPAGVILVLLVATRFRRDTFAMARISAGFRFAACALLYLCLLAIAHGRISRELGLFMLLGYAAELRAARRAIATAWMLRPPLLTR
ncbi:hypothetical protein [Bradyrhizobium iriomotense]|uniref:hypothetical protein n=1 Tax=Bradyrhizobium iriomotense TaxID=441950 RepID=UPI001B89F462|nr:hypothetical protein [Bradyrhizobium iriomotense]MBR1129723.1 hypothetical protein [Bradyrhizobium iriomotense]